MPTYCAVSSSLRRKQIFLVSFLSAELPSGLISKKLGADVWIPCIIVGWSLVAGSQAFLSNRASFYAVKCLLGLLMGGFIPYVQLHDADETNQTG